MKVSVIIPLYNKEKYIKRAINSVFSQTYQNFELMIVNDGSTDNSIKIIHSFNDERLKIVSQKNKGVSAARNTGIKCALGDLIAFLDADDEWLPTHLETIIRQANNYPHVGMFGNAWCYKRDDGMKVFPNFAGIPDPPWEGVIPNYFKSVAEGDPIIFSSAVVIKKIVFDSVGYFQIGARMGEDLDMWLRIAMQYPVCFSYTYTAIYHISDNNRATYKYFLKDIKSPIITKWYKYILHNKFLTKYILKSQLFFIKGIIKGLLLQTNKFSGKND